MDNPVYITRANLKSIVRKAKLDWKPEGQVWKRTIYFFNRYEEAALIAIKHLLADPEKYFSEIYVPYRNEDSHQYVYQETKPAFHSLCECHRLHSDFENYKIPSEIRRRGRDEVLRFRKWFETNVHLLNGKEDLFAFRLQNEFQISEVPEYVKYENSGFEAHENLSLEELEARIDARIKEAGRYFYGCKKNTDILRVYSRHAYRGFKDDDLPKQIPGYEEEDVKAFLRDYEERFKKPLQGDLVEYYRRNLNPEIAMPGPILNQLGFKQCSSCADTQLV